MGSTNTVFRTPQRWRVHLGCAVVTIAVAACPIPEQVVPITLDAVTSLRIGALTDDAVVLEVTMRAAFKPGSILDEVNVQDVEAQVSIEDVPIGTAKRDEVKLVRGGDMTLPLTLRVPYDSITLPMLRALKTGRVRYLADVTASAPAFAKLGLSTRLRGELEVPNNVVPSVAGVLSKQQLRLTGGIIDMKRSGFHGIYMTMQVEVTNPFSFPITVKGIKYSATLGGFPVGKGKMKAPVTLKPGVPVTFPVEHKAPADPLLVADLAFRSAPVTIRLVGTLHVEPIAGIKSMPFDLEVSAPIPVPEAPPRRRR